MTLYILPPEDDLNLMRRAYSVGLTIQKELLNPMSVNGFNYWALEGGVYIPFERTEFTNQLMYCISGKCSFVIPNTDFWT